MKAISAIASIISLSIYLQAGLEIFDMNYSQFKKASSEIENSNEAIVRFSRFVQASKQKNRQNISAFENPYVS